MNTLQSTLQNKIHNWKDMKNAMQTVSENVFPVEIEGINGGMQGFFIAELSEQRRSELLQSLKYGNTPPVNKAQDFLLIVPTEKDAETLIEDLHGVFPDVKDKETGKDKCTAEILTFPWWGLVPYRPASKGSLVFGERAALLSKLAQSDRTYKNGSQKTTWTVAERGALTASAALVTPTDAIELLPTSTADCAAWYHANSDAEDDYERVVASL